MNLKEFEKYSFRKSTEVLVEYDGIKDWHKVEAVDFERNTIEIDFGIFGIDLILAIKD